MTRLKGQLALGAVLALVAAACGPGGGSSTGPTSPAATGGTGMSTIPIIAFAPIMINWFGFESQLPRITVVALMTFFPVMVNTIRGLTQVDPAALELMDSYAASSFQVLRKVRVPNALPYWFTALRIAVTLSVIGAVVGEFFGGPLYSLGIYVTNQTGSFKYPNAWAAIVIACVLGIALYLIAVLIERVAMPWRRGDTAGGE